MEMSKIDMSKRREIVYYRRGMQDGSPVYSGIGTNGGELQPYMTRRHCQQDALKQDGKAVFVDTSLTKALKVLLPEETLKKKRRHYTYLPCKDAPDGKHKWSRFHHNDFDTCNLCGEARFAMRQNED